MKSRNKSHQVISNHIVMRACVCWAARADGQTVAGSHRLRNYMAEQNVHPYTHGEGCVRMHRAKLNRKRKKKKKTSSTRKKIEIGCAAMHIHFIRRSLANNFHVIFYFRTVRRHFGAVSTRQGENIVCHSKDRTVMCDLLQTEWLPRIDIA